MKKLYAVILLLAILTALFAGCTGATPDEVLEASTAIGVEDVNWTITVEIDGGESTTYTIAQAKEHELTKVYCSFRYAATESVDSPQVTTAIFEGVKVKDFLADIGYPDAKGLTVYHSHTDYYKVPFEYGEELIQDDGTVLAWIQNKTEIIKNSSTFVAFAATNGGVNDFCSSITKIIVHP
ncbi:MAG: hypothetical protein IKM13_08395 [Clostridia bacterium]|nr:hypothetical protein [Clostridia bacterium]